MEKETGRELKRSSGLLLSQARIIYTSVIPDTSCTNCSLKSRVTEPAQDRQAADPRVSVLVHHLKKNPTPAGLILVKLNPTPSLTVTEVHYFLCAPP